MGESFIPDNNGRVRGINGPHRIKGVPYDNLGEACTILGFEYDTIYKRMARNADISAEDAMYNFEEYSRFKDGKEAQYNGVTYRSIEELGEAVGLNAHSISRLNRKYGYPYEVCVMILKTGYHFGSFYEHDGKLYVSQIHLAEAHGTTQNRVKSIQTYHGYETFYEAFLHYIKNTVPKPRKNNP